MTNRFNAKAPAAIRGKEAWKHLWENTLPDIKTIFEQVFTQYQEQPDNPADFPEETNEPDDKQLEQCQLIFKQSEERRLHIEQKAQSLFSLIIFMAPALGSMFVFIYKDSPPIGTTGWIIIILIFMSFVLLALGFISVMRAISVKAHEILFIESVVDKKSGKFKEYSKAYHAQGLLYCASINTAINDHIAQFTKGAQVLMIFAAILSLIASILAGIAHSNRPPSAVKPEIFSAAGISPPNFKQMMDDVSILRTLAEAKNQDNTRDERYKSLDERLGRVEAELQKAQPEPRATSWDPISSLFHWCYRILYGESTPTSP